VPTELFDEQASAMAAPVTRESAGLFTLDEAGRAYVRDELMPLGRRIGRRDALIRLLLHGDLRLLYDATYTRNAAQTLQARAGNCLSLVAMTTALADALDLPVSFQQVTNEETWSRVGGMVVLNAHVNVIIGRYQADRDLGVDKERRLIIDFLPPEDIRGQVSRRIERATVEAMYMNNRAVEALIDDRPADAYRWARGAIETDAAYYASYNTLALVHRQRGDLPRAEQALRIALDAEPRNTQLLANLAELMDDQARPAEAASLRTRLAREESVPPFHWLQRGQDAMGEGRYAEARALFDKELARDPYYHETHFWMALAERALGHEDAAREHLTIARQESVTEGQRAIYTAKLDRLNALRTR